MKFKVIKAELKKGIKSLRREVDDEYQMHGGSLQFQYWRGKLNGAIFALDALKEVRRKRKKKARLEADRLKYAKKLKYMKYRLNKR